ncbi:hypothetical protein [Kibdelosporangium phytohabitans]|uniref:Outer membrane channel protein CpnT-like N-terminal domain-containing protein n=1 Tax=Kibdelosporangium phytohabitans TaxID=860235 RepID=A0A0N9I926_9PSEU|nr:hypothetical protein [Kibdelosporangium phytohabitans]ALG12886.1 hypothetical protein AOZ06_43925 [Kibdelosporangium phytohabitans]MBE1464590.1 hypothetical protein [Kibdelosporangium phytohabitans]
MGIEVPGEVKWLAAKVIGTDWPEGDETALRRLADLWEDAAKAVDEVAKDGDAAAKAALPGMKSEGGEKFRQHWDGFTRGGDADYPRLAALCRKIADACRKSATSIEYTKLSIIAALIILAAQIAALVASAVATLGSSTAGIPIAMTATRVVVMKLLTELLKQIAINVAINLGVDLGIQTYQAASGNRDEWDAGKTGKAIQAGAIAGAAGGLVGGGATAASIRAANRPVTRLTNEAGEEIAEQQSRVFSRAVANTMGTNSSNFGSAAARGAAQGATAGAVGNVSNDFVNGKRGSELLGSAIAGSSTGAVGGALGGTVNRHEGLKDAYFPDGQGLDHRVDGGPRHRQDPVEPTGPWTSTQAQRIPDSPPNNGNDEADDHPEIRWRQGL